MQKICNPSSIKRFQPNDRSASARQATVKKHDIENVETCVGKQKNESVRSRSGSRSRRRTTLTRPISAPVIRTESEAKRMHTKQQSSSKFNRTSSYRKKQVILKALSFKNGSNENPILITSHTVKHVSFLFFLSLSFNLNLSFFL